MLVFFAHLLGVGSAIDAVMTSRTPQGSIAWATSLLTFPYLAVPAYWVFGRSKFQGMSEARRENEAEIERLLAEITPKITSTFVPVQDRIPEYEALLNLAQLGMTDGNRIDLLVDGEETYDSIIEGINAAKDYVLIEFYIVRDDGAGQRLKDALIERANNGVDVYFVYDEVGSKDLSASYKQALREAGVSVTKFGTTRGWRNRFQLNFRNHRKIVVVDGHHAWVGGLNIGDDYLGKNPKLSPWRDTHLKVSGPAALQAQVVFMSDWYWATRRLPDLSWRVTVDNENAAQVMMIASSPAQQLETGGLFFAHSIGTARDRVWIATPYFIPDQSLMTALQLAALRGVDVRIIVPRKSDNFLIQPATYFYMEELSGLGIRFYEYTKGFSHQKVMLIDSDIASVGTANFDVRSFRLNFEINALVRNLDFAASVEQMLLLDIRHSELVDLDALKAQPYWRHVLHRVARLFSPVL